MAKAIFIGINYYDKVAGCQNLKLIPSIYAKSMLSALTDLTEFFKYEQCLFFTDRPNPVVQDGVKVDQPTKGNVTAALTSMVANAKKGESLLVYFCGHGANEYQNSRGALKTLHKDLDRLDVLYSTELDAIMKNLPSGVNITFLIHACFSGAMFSYTPAKTKGVALTSVGPDVPSAVTTLPDAVDFTVHIRDEIIKKLPKAGPSDAAWPTYEQVWESVRKITVSGQTPDGKSFTGHAEIYHAPSESASCTCKKTAGKPTTDKFLF